MTAPDVDHLREQIAQSIAGWWVGEPGHEIDWVEGSEIAAALLPLVVAYGDQRAADERASISRDGQKALVGLIATICATDPKETT